jgi:hypothetical protein
VAGSVRQTARGPRSFGSHRVSFLALRTKWWRDALTSATTAACGAEDGRRPPAGDAPAAAGGGLESSKENYHSTVFAHHESPQVAADPAHFVSLDPVHFNFR